MTRTKIVERARLALVGPDVSYLLGHGGVYPALPGPGPRCDCSGFVAWCLGVSRRQPDTLGWIETTRVYEDAHRGHKLFREVHDPEPGDVIVYGDRTEKVVHHDPDGTEHVRDRVRQGHIGVLSVVPPAVFGPLWWSELRVIHCSASNKPNAIAETDARAFRGRAIFARWIGDVGPA